MTTPTADQQYYHEHQLSGDRIALWWYARLIRTLRPRGGRLLDFGCGTGHLLKRLSRHFDAFGYDATACARHESRTNAPEAIILEEWLSLPVASLDVIVALHALEHLPQPLPTMAALVRKLKPGGVFVFVVPHVGGIGHRMKGRRWFAYRDPTHVSLLSPGEWTRLARKAGLTAVTVHGDGLWDAPYVRMVPTAIQRVVFGAPAALQVLWPGNRAFLPAAFGECLIVTAQRAG
ncbi:MAG: class I SAM-dependent methyltransferase [Candidatus Binatia bacterium]